MKSERKLDSERGTKYPRIKENAREKQRKEVESDLVDLVLGARALAIRYLVKEIILPH